MNRTVVEMFAGVGGFRCGLNHIDKTANDTDKEIWKTVWFNQWEPADKKKQWAHDCYKFHFGECADLNGNITTGMDIHSVDKTVIPDHSLLVGGFPCQDYSVASSLATSKGIEGKKGVLWWDIRDVLEKKRPPFVLLENVDRLLKSPAKQRGRDFGIILGCFRDLGYSVEWRVINAADYGYQQRRRRVFIFAYRNTTSYAVKQGQRYITRDSVSMAEDILQNRGFFAEIFPVCPIDNKEIEIMLMPEKIGDISECFSYDFKNSGLLSTNGVIFTTKSMPSYNGATKTIGDILEKGPVDERFFIPEKKLYYTAHDITHSDETEEKLSVEARHTWQYIKGGKRMKRTAKNGHEYIYSEGPVPMIDEWDKPARTMLTGEGSFSRTTHIVKDRQSGRIRLLTPEEMERIQGFPTGWTEYALSDDGNDKIKMPLSRRRFMMGNALVVNLIGQMEPNLRDIVDNE